MTQKTLTGDPLRPKGFRIAAFDLLLSSLTINILSLALPTMTLQIYDRILPNPESGTLPVLVSGVCIAVVLETIMRLGRVYGIGWAGAAYEHRLSCEAMSHLLESDLSRIGTYGIGENMNRLASIGRLKDFYNGYSMIVLFELCFVPLFLALIVYIAGPLAAVPGGILMIFTAVNFMQGKKLRAVLLDRDETDDRRYDFLIESLEGIHSLKSFGLENIFARRYEALEEHSTIANYRVTEESAKTFDTASVFANLMSTAVIGVGAVLVLHNTISTGALIATVLLSGRIMQPVQRALGLWAKYQDFSISKAKVESIFEAPLHPVVRMQGTSPAREGTLLLKDIWFRRTDSAPWLLENVNLSLARGECIAIETDNTPSLTALLDIIAGIYPATRGEAMVDGQNILRFPYVDLLNHVGYVQNEAVIFRGTIRENLTCFGQIADDRVREMSALFQIDKDIAALPSGFDTYLNGNASDTIPPGLKQRISLVRTLAPKPRLIIFDNADRSLDRNGYNLLYSLLARLQGQASIVICSDDHNLVAQTTKKYQLTQGRLVEIPRSVAAPKDVQYRELRL